MSQVKLTLRPPPNVDFVHGYPGIPSGGPDRPQAAVKGAVEVRVGPQGVKAEWVRIELRKVETLPGGGQTNIFYDFVGPSPVNLWTASEETGPLLRTQDFPFSIRIPESIPPSIALENRAGIKYELSASVCTKGKKGFWRKRKSVVVSTQAAIIIDKHELHSTWPVYCQHESRQVSQDGVTLTVDRSNTCYGPGDRVSIIAALKSDSLHTVLLRGFELTLKESTIFRAGHYTQGKKTAPQVRVTTISESKLPVNDTLYGGTSRKAELTCGISPNHTTTTLNAARHIDITYVLSVKALMGTGNHISMDLPVIVSNWQRSVSHEAIRRIGPAPSLSLLPLNAMTPAAHPPAAPIMTTQPVSSRPSAAATLPQNRVPAPAEYGFGRNPSATAYSTLPAQSASYAPPPPSKADEFGYGVGYGGRAPHMTHKPTTSNSSKDGMDEFGTRPTAAVATPAATTTQATGRRPGSAGRGANDARRPGSAGRGANTNRFTITNLLPSEISEDEGARSQGGSKGQQQHWPSAEEEKRRYEAARAKVERVQGGDAIRTNTPPPNVVPPAMQHSPSAQASTIGSRNGAYMTAEEEKAQIRFREAQAAVRRAQGLDASPPSLHGRSNSDLARAASSSSKPTSSAAALYSQAMSTQIKSQPARAQTYNSSPVKVPVPQYLTAEQEKAALRRYEEAKQAVDRTQGMGYSSDDGGQSSSSPSAPIAYDSLYPAAPSGSSSSPPPANDLPPPFEMPASAISSAISEKERVRRAYEAQDAATLAYQQNQAPSYSSPPPFTSAPPPSVGGSSIHSAIAEKEQLRRKFEAQDAEAMMGSPGRASPPQPPPRGSSRNNARPTPAPPSASGGSQRILTAAEEKAMLRARYDAEDSGGSSRPHVNGNGNAYINGTPPRSGAPLSPSPSLSAASIPVPPPLMPRPPKDYIQETQEEDARVSQYVLNGTVPAINPNEVPLPKTNGTAGIDMQPFTPFTPGFGSVTKVPGPPPPLPPKPAGE